MGKYTPIIGLEIHVHLSTQSKLFCSCPRKVDKEQFAQDASANINICPICLGLPGAMPFLNEEAVEKAMRIGLALGCKINDLSIWDRKNYMYPDLFNGYQISQMDNPLNYSGAVEISNKTIRVNRAHLENDAAKSLHLGNFTALNGNKSGCAMVEIVSEPDIRTATEAKEYAEKVREIVRWVEASDADMYLGEMRFDINVSLCVEGDPENDFKNIKHTPIVEVKNRNSFKELVDVINYEIKRQEEEYDKTGIIYAKGGKTTMGWDEAKGKTMFQREKEEADDYRYFHEPDVPPVVTTPEKIEEVRSKMPKPANEVVAELINETGSDKRTVSFLVTDRDKYKFFSECVEIDSTLKKNYINWIAGDMAGLMTANFTEFEDLGLRPGTLVDIVKNVVENKISHAVGKELLKECIETNDNLDIYKVIEDRGLGKVSDTSMIEEIIDTALKSNPKVIDDIKSGKDNAKMFIVGVVMRESKGKADVNIIREILDRKLKDLI